jgi:POT family proton-dependent oligopeptide transporter
VIGGLALATFVYLYAFAGLDKLGQRRIIAMFVLFLASVFFWMGFEQVGSSFNLFAERYTDRVLDTFQFEIPAAWFQSVNTVQILIFAPLFAMLWLSLSKRNRDWPLAAKIAMGLVLLAAGFLVMSGAASFANDGIKVAPMWLIMTYLLHTFGELCLSPVGMSAFSKLVPERLIGLILGLFFLSLSLGNLLAGLVAGQFDASNLAVMSGQFAKIAAFVLVPGVLLLLFAKPLQKLTGGVR